MRIEIVAYDGMDEMDAIGPFEVFRNAAQMGTGWDVALVAPREAGPIVAGHGLRMELTEVLGTPDALLVPGGSYMSRAPQGTWAEIQNGYLPSRLREVAPGCQWVASVCTGAMLLAAAGLTEDRPAVTHHAAHQELKDSGALLIPEARIVDDGDLITCGGVTSGLDLALWMVEREAGPELATKIATFMEYERGGKLYRAGALV